MVSMTSYGDVSVMTTVESEALTVVDSPEECTAKTGLRIPQSIKLYDVVQYREQNRKDGGRDLLIQLADWLVSQDAQATEWLIVGGLEDYSEKAYKAGGVFYVDAEWLDDDNSLFEDVYVNNVLNRHTNEGSEYDTPEGVRWIPKSQVENIVVLGE